MRCPAHNPATGPSGHENGQSRTLRINALPFARAVNVTERAQFNIFVDISRFTLLRVKLDAKV